MPETLESGRPRRLTCSVPWACEWGTPPVFSWTSAALPTLGPRTPLSSVVTLTPRPQDHGTSLTCQVMFPASGVTVGRTIQLNVTCERWAGSGERSRQSWAGPDMGGVLRTKQEGTPHTYFHGSWGDRPHAHPSPWMLMPPIPLSQMPHGT